MNDHMYRVRMSLGLAVAGAVLWAAHRMLLDSEPPVFPALLFSVSFGLLFWIMSGETFFRRCVGESTAESLGFVRILTCSILFFKVLWYEDIPSTALIPTEMTHSMGTMGIFYKLPGFESFVRSQSSLQVFEWVTGALLVLGALGWRTRIVIPMAAMCCLISEGIIRHYTWFFHTGLIPVYVMWILSVTPCGDGLSLDRLRNARLGRDSPSNETRSPIYGWARYGCFVVIAMPYFAAGMSKICDGGPLWCSATNMRSILYRCNLTPMDFDFDLALYLHNAPDAFFWMLGIGGVYGELAFGTVLVSKTMRMIMPAVMAMMHVGILLLQNILFYDLILLQLIFYDYTRVRQFISSRLTHQPAESRLPDDDQPGTTPQALSAGTDHVRTESLRHPQDGSRPKKPLLPPLAVSGLITVFLVCWGNSVEFYPFTSMQMFSGRKTSGEITYFKVIANYESGESSPLRPDEAIPGLRTRIRRVIKEFINDPDSKKKSQRCKVLLETLGSIHNNQASEKERISSISVQKWQWNFREDPPGEEYGELVDEEVFEIK